MADLHQVLPDFDLVPYRHLIHSLEKNGITVAELISVDPLETARRCPLPLLDTKRLVDAIVLALQKQLDVHDGVAGTSGGVSRALTSLGSSSAPYVANWTTDIHILKTLDAGIDQILGGGFYTGHITEVVGESASGKTQLVLGLLLAVQMPPPHGLGKSAIYLSTEAALSTKRLHQMLASHPAYEALPRDERPSMDHVRAFSTNNLEQQEHIIEFQLPIAVQRFNVGLVVVDSVAANFRAERSTRSSAGLISRAVDLVKLGRILRRIATEYGVAVVVTNQVGDRFDDTSRLVKDRLGVSSPSNAPSSSSQRTNMPAPGAQQLDEAISLDHQQRFFTGWGAEPNIGHEDLKTPALGLSWANQISARVVLKIESARPQIQAYKGGNIWREGRRRRFMGIVFAPWTRPSINLLEYEITMQGILSIPKGTNASQDGALLVKTEAGDPIEAAEQGHFELLDTTLWEDDDEEFP